MQFNLNPQQEEAVNHRDGPLLIIAGAGTGKTAVITQRIIDLVKSGDAKPSEILALTFTEKAAAEMIERVDVEMPIGYEEIAISTFHSFCDSVLRRDGVYLGLDSNYTLMSEAHSYILFRRNLFTLPLEQLRPMGNPTSNITAILKHFSRLQDEDVSPGDYQKYLDQLPRGSELEDEQYTLTKELVDTYKAFTELKISESKLGFGDLIIQTLRLFRERPTVLQRYHQQYKYILVDEFQDTNHTQNVLVNLIALGKEPEDATREERDSVNVTVVGDDDQAIYKFRGAAISNILHFKEAYPAARKIVLNENYRSRQEILDASYQLIQHNNPDRLEITEDVPKRLISKVDFPRKAKRPVRLMVADRASEEADLVAYEILRLTGNQDQLKDINNIVEKQFDDEGQAMFLDVDKGENEKFNFSDIAILVRANNHSDEFVRAFKYLGIPYKFGGTRGLYSRAEITPLIAFLRVLVDFEDDMSIFSLLQMDEWGLSARELTELMQNSRRKKSSVIEQFEEMLGIKIGESKDEEILTAQPSNLLQQMLTQNSIEAIKRLLVRINVGIVQGQKRLTTGQILLDFFKDSGYLNSLTESEDLEAEFKVKNISKFFDLIKTFEQTNRGATVFDYVNYLDYSIEVGENPTTEMDVLEGINAVNIMTVHGAKGLEYPVVFMVNLVSERFPSRNRKDKIPIPDDLIKEVVADVDSTTEHLREERRLFYVGATRAQERLYLTAARFYGDAKQRKKPSIFLDELLDRKVAEEFENDKDITAKPAQFSVYVSTHDDSFAVDEENDLYIPDYLSYSHIDTYLTCPKQYRYRYVLGVPGKPGHALSFGRTVHNTLLAFYRELKSYKDGLPGFAELPTKERLLQIYEDKWISAGYEDRRHERLRKEKGVKSLEQFYEQLFDSDAEILGLETTFKYKFDHFIMKGAIDRIDKVGERNGKPLVDLIDYKTGKVKDEKDVKKDLQLAIYAIVAEESFGYEVNGACLIFLEHGVKMSVEIDDIRKEQVKKDISKVVDQIRKRQFGATPGFPQCNYCDYREICEDAQVVTF